MTKYKGTDAKTLEQMESGISDEALRQAEEARWNCFSYAVGLTTGRLTQASVEKKLTELAGPQFVRDLKSSLGYLGTLLSSEGAARERRDLL